MASWITDRLPTKADADFYDEVLAEMPGEIWGSFTKWDQLPTGTPWRHTSVWRSPDGATPTTAIPRLFTSITHADDRFVALADDGTAWFISFGDKCGWLQLPPLPAREVEQSNG